MFTRDHSDVTGYGFAVGEAPRITEKHFRGQRGHRSNARMSHQPKRVWSLLHLGFDLAIQMVDRVLKLGIQREQRIALLGGARGKERRVCWPAGVQRECPRRNP
jgi:hypothetical protein